MNEYYSLLITTSQSNELVARKYFAQLIAAKCLALRNTNFFNKVIGSGISVSMLEESAGVSRIGIGADSTDFQVD